MQTMLKKRIPYVGMVIKTQKQASIEKIEAKYKYNDNNSKSAKREKENERIL